MYVPSHLGTGRRAANYFPDCMLHFAVSILMVSSDTTVRDKKVFARESQAQLNGDGLEAWQWGSRASLGECR
jgi:hypothetical protein